VLSEGVRHGGGDARNVISEGVDDVLAVCHLQDPFGWW
jgi:hypothetical protein